MQRLHAPAQHQDAPVLFTYARQIADLEAKLLQLAREHAGRIQLQCLQEAPDFLQSGDQPVQATEVELILRPGYCVHGLAHGPVQGLTDPAVCLWMW